MKTIPSELIPPPAWFEAHRFRGWNVPVTITREPRVLRLIIGFPTPAGCVKTRDRCLANARACRIMESRARKDAAAQYGDAGGVNRFPVSGGVCDHWPREVIDSVVEFLHLKQDWMAAALAWHLLAGKRQSTFRNLPGIPS